MILPFTVERHAEIDSTNLEAMRHARKGAKAGLAILADRQNAGQGRHGRTWHSPPGNLFLSLLLRPEIAAAKLSELAFVAALGVADAVDGFLPSQKVALKWPNDILLDGAKLSGILIENELAGSHVDWSVIGIGVNIASAPDGTPYKATFLHHHGATCSRDEVADAVMTCFATRYAQWQTQGFEAIRKDWTGRAWKLGAPIAIDAGGASLTGRFEGIDDTGALRLATAEGERRVLSGSLSYGSAA